MDTRNHNLIYSRKLSWLFVVLVLVSLFACASSPDAKTEVTVMSDGEAANGGTEISTINEAVSTDPVSGSNVAEQTITNPVAEPVKITPPRIVKSCKDEPYAKYEKQARDSMAKGLSATTAGKYGVGFRDLKEHKKWSGIHKQLFNKVNEACGVLSKCAKQHPKEKAAECVEQARIFNEWQNMAERFATKAKMVETTQPDKICSFRPNLADDPQCFHGLADNIDKSCDTAACKELSDCWRGIGFLDSATKQAAQACGFVFKKLSDCRGYTEATKRRMKKFEQCKEMQGPLDIVKFPSL